MPKKSIISVIVLLVLVNLAVFGYYYYQKRNTSKQSQSNTNLTASELLAGKVKDINNQTFVLEVESDSGLKTYNVTISQATLIERKAQAIPYLFNEKGDTATPVRAAVTDIKKDTIVEVTTQSDISGNNIEAASVLLPRATYILEGIIIDVGTNSMVVDAAPVVEVVQNANSDTFEPQKHANYTIKVTKDTEISRVPGAEDPTKVPPKKYSLSELSSGQEVIIYTQADVTTSTEFDAARIEPVL